MEAVGFWTGLFSLDLGGLAGFADSTLGIAFSPIGSTAASFSSAPAASPSSESASDISNSHSGWPWEIHLVSLAWTVLSSTSAKIPARNPVVNKQVGTSDWPFSIASKQLLIATL